MRLPVRSIIVVFILVSVVTFWTWPQTGDTKALQEDEEFETVLERSKTKKRKGSYRSLSSNVIKKDIDKEFISGSDYNRLILDHGFPDCHNRTLFNGNAGYSLPDVLKKVREFVPPPADFVPDLKNPCWYANYDDAKKEINWRANYSNIIHTRQDVSHLIKNTNGKKSLYCLPYMYLLGYPKCGTTSLFDYFKKHPEFATLSSRGCGWIGTHSSGLVKDRRANVRAMLHLVEHFYLASSQVHLSSINGNSNDMIIADFSPASSWRQSGFEQNMDGSMCDPPLLMKEMQPDAKFVVLIREPISRLYSAFWFYASTKLKEKLIKNKGPQLFTEDVHTFFDRLKRCSKDVSMLTCIRAAKDFHHHFERDDQLLTGFYHLYLLPWLQVFPRENFLFIRSEDMKEDTEKALKEIFEFLEMSPLPDDVLKDTVKTVLHNQKILHSSNSNLLLSPSTKQQLRTYFRPFNEKLAELLEDDKYLWEDVED
ncbi:carbohydrate sulfotransferase 15-like [Dysidea avara]|uniref:carbohydrate sulfotransferase 15-like n=1 Tax=Dysidea avara TaxID=196820 RepID=UPI0033318B15